MITELATPNMPDAVPVGPVQHAWRFQHAGQGPLAAMCAYDVRRQLQARGVPVEGLSVYQSCETLSVVARNPLSSQWMTEHLGSLLGVVADIAGQVMAVTPVSDAVASNSGGRRLYTIPTLIVERSKKSCDWAVWKPEHLDEAQHTRMSALILGGIQAELRIWGVDDTLAPIIIVNAGRPMPIVPAAGPRGMGRLGVQFVMQQDLDGQLFVGAHTLMGYGRIMRGGLLTSSN